VEEVSVELLNDIVEGRVTENWYIKFYGPNCGFCKGMEEEWEALAKMVDEEDYDMRIGQVNVHDSLFQVPEFRSIFPGPLPGLHWFPTDQPKYFYEYPSPRLPATAEVYLSFAILTYENTPKSFRKAEYMYEVETPILNIPGEKFDETIESGDRYIVMFYGSKCGWCKQMMPLWEQFATETKEQNRDWVVSRMEGFSKMSVIDRYTARPWPSIVFLEEGRYYRMDTEDVRAITTTEELFEWIESGAYKEVGEEYSGEDEGQVYYKKLKIAKEKAKKKKSAEL